MSKEHTNNKIPAANVPGSAELSDKTNDILKDFSENAQTLAAARKKLEREVAVLKGELEKLAKEKEVLETDIGKTMDVSEIAMAAKASEEEKLDVLKKNQELRAYLDSAGEKVNKLKSKLSESDIKIEQLIEKVNTLECEKEAFIKEKEELGLKIVKMTDVIKEQDLKVKEFSIRAETMEDEKKAVENKYEETKKTLNEIQKSMISVSERVKKTYSGQMP